MPPYALRPDLNARVFLAGEEASAEAALAYVPGGATEETGLWNLVFEAPGGASTGGGVRDGEYRVFADQGRYRVTGTRAGLRRFIRAAPEAWTEELRAALEAFARGREPRKTRVMGILNLTPDSFSDGGRYTDRQTSVEHALRMVAEGADLLDLGGESTRPGATTVSEEEELERVLPVLRALRPRTNAELSIDTRKARVAEACLDEGADWINDVSGLCFDPALAGCVARYPHARLALMHFRRRPEDDRFSTEYDDRGQPVYADVVADTMRWLRTRVGIALEAGIDRERIWIDPGFGFGKTPAQNVELLRRLREYTCMGLPVLLGTSRKSTIGRLLGDAPPGERLEGTAATVVWAIANGVSAIRVHDVREMSRIARAADALSAGLR